jgi:glucosamine--fructose-6-phosphate aminotransferase (isomerizing)
VSTFHDEIAAQPGIAAAMLGAGRAAVDSIGSRIREANPRGFLIAARGSSDHAALYAKYLFGRRNRALVSLAAPSLFTHYASPPRLDGQCVIGISQSGSSPDVIAVLEEAARQGALTVGLTNDPESKLAGAAELVVIHARDADADIAVMKLDRDDLPAARLGNSDTAVVGTWVLALGSPFGFLATKKPTARLHWRWV